MITSFLKGMRTSLSLLFISLITSQLNAQVDTEFWFAAPYVNVDHTIPGIQGGRPVYMVVSSLSSPSLVTISVPANPNIAPMQIVLSANETQKVELTGLVEEITASRNGGVVEQKGLLVTSTDNITAYYEIGAVLNPDIFSLKGTNALGTNFFTPFQNAWDNDPKHDEVDPAFSAIDIVATENNTRIWVALTADANGFSAGDTISVILNRGETYSVKASGQAGTEHLTGTHVWSSRPIAVSIKDDSVYDPQVGSGECEDFVGDQIVSTDLIGNEYIVMKGRLDEGSTPIPEYVFFTATEDRTRVEIDGYVFNLNAGETGRFDVNTVDNSPYNMITSNKNIYCFHLSGYQCEQAGALLPPVNLCTGSYNIGFARSYGSSNAERFFMNLMVRAGGEDSFLIDGAAHPVIESAEFVQVNDDWSVVSMEFSRTQLPAGIHDIRNTTQPFHLATLNATSYNWGDGFRLMGSNYGYFSNFDLEEPEVTIVNNNDTIIAVPFGTEVQFRATGGYEFNWTGYELTDQGWVEMASPYYLNEITSYNPIVNNTLPVGYYRYKAEIQSACLGSVEEYLYLEVGEPGTFTDVSDTVCETTPGSGCSDIEYHLNNLNNSIVDEASRGFGYYVDEWYASIEAGSSTLDDFEGNGKLSILPPVQYANGSATIVTNTTSGNDSDHILFLNKTEKDGDPQGLGAFVELGLNGILLSEGAELSFQYRYDGTSLVPSQYNNWRLGDHQGELQIFNQNGAVIATSQFTIPRNEIESPVWRTFSYAASASASNQTISKIRITFTAGFWLDSEISRYGYFLDNFQWSHNGYREKIETETATICDGDSVYAVIRNETLPFFIDTAMARFAVVNERLPLPSQTVEVCASEGTVVNNFDITYYNNLFPSLVGDKTWYSDVSLTTELPNPTNMQVSNGDTYYIYIDDACGQNGVLNIIVNPGPADDSVTIAICESSQGGSLVNLNDYNTYLHPDAISSIWYNSESMIIPVGNQDSYTVHSGDVLYAEVQTASCNYTLVVNFSLEEGVAVALDPIGNVCDNESTIALSASPAGGTFTINGVEITEFVPSNYASGNYELVYTIEQGDCAWSASTNFTVFNAPDASLIVRDEYTDTLATGAMDSIQFRHAGYVIANIEGGEGMVNYEWNHPELLLRPDTLASETVILEDSVTFQIIATDEQGCADTASQFVWVWGIPVTIDIEVVKNPVCLGDAVPLVAHVHGGFAPFQYSWNTGETIIKNTGDRDEIRIDTIWITPTEDTEISVALTDFGWITGDTIVYDTVNVNITLPPHIVDGRSQIFEVCEGNSLPIHVDVESGTLPYIFQWIGNNALIANPADETLTLEDTLTNGTYPFQYVVTDAHGCTDTADILAQVNDVPFIGMLEDSALCQYSSLLYENELGFTWLGNHAGLIENPTENPVSINTSVPGEYKIYYNFTTQEGCTADDSVEITVFDRPSVTITADPEFDGEIYTHIDITLQATVAGGTLPYVDAQTGWVPNEELIVDSLEPTNAMFNLENEQNISFTYRVEDSNGCTNSDTYAKYLNPIDTIDFGFGGLACTGTDYHYMLNRPYRQDLLWTITGDAEFEWVNSNSSGDNVELRWLTAGTAYITVDDDETDMSNITPVLRKTIRVEVLPRPTAHIVGPDRVCEWENELYVAEEDYFVNGYDIVHQWHLISDTAIAQHPIDTSTFASAQFDTLVNPWSSQTYVRWETMDIDTLVMSMYHDTLQSCRSTDVKIVVIDSLPKPSFSYNNEPVYAENEMQFTNTTLPEGTASNNLRFIWDFIGDDIYTSEDENPVYTYDQNGDFIAQLTAIDYGTGCRAKVSETIPIPVNPNCGLRFPNVFTPLLDEYNSFSYGYKVGVVHKDYILRVFSRSGALIWETTDRDERWDGTYNGNIAKQDTYVYQCDALCENGEILSINGDVTLLK